MITLGVVAAIERGDPRSRRPGPLSLDLVFKLGASNVLHLLWCDAVDFGDARPRPATGAAPPRTAESKAAPPEADAAPRRPASAKGPRRRPFQKRCERLFHAKITHPSDITVLSYLGADHGRDDRKRVDIARLERDFSRKRAIPTDFVSFVRPA